MENQNRDLQLLSSSQSAYDIVFLSYKKEGTCKNFYTEAMINLHTWVQVEVTWVNILGQNHKVMKYIRVNAENKFYNFQTELELVGDMTFHQHGERWVAQML